MDCDAGQSPLFNCVIVSAVDKTAARRKQKPAGVMLAGGVVGKNFS
jgi:hypothetical protein